MLSVSPGHSVEYLTREVATGRENYYTGAVTEGEPPGRWYGAGADALGLTGLVDHQDMQALFERYLDPRDEHFRDRDAWDLAATLGHRGRSYLTAEQIYARSVDAEPDADAERRDQLRRDASKRERRNVAFMDVTFSVPKSVTVLHAAFEAQEVKARGRGDHAAAQAWAAHKQAVEDAIWAGNNAALDYLQEHAGYSRIGHHGGAAGRFIDAHDFTIASFLQHTSRTNDPQLHIHNAILSRVQCADGQWRALDGRSLYLHRPAAAAVAERTTFEHLGQALRVHAAMRPDGKSREILGIPDQANDLFSTRRRAITPKTAELVTAFQTRYGRDPNALELDRLQRHATMATRPRKSHDGETLEQRLDRMEHRLRAELDLSLAQIATDVLALADTGAPAVEPFDIGVVIETALADAQATKAAWTEADLMRAINDALPDHLGGLDSSQVQQLLRGLTTQAISQHALTLVADAPGTQTLPAELRLADGRPAYERPGSRVYATDAHLRSERALRAAALDHSAAAISHDAAARFITGVADSGIDLGPDQAAAVRGVLSSSSRVESLVGPAGTGKSFVVGLIAQAWQAPAHWPDGQPRSVVGLASSQIATDVLADEGLDARNITRWLATQQRLADGTAHRDEHAWRVHPGDLVVVDECAMADTAHLARIHHIVTTADAKLLLVGDHRQLAAIGAGGGMQLAADAGRAYELTEARRFTHDWERAASLQLREGDDTALAIYRKHGRIIDGGPIERTEQHAARGWLADTLAGKRSLLIVDTNEQAARLSAQLRAELVRLGRVNEAGVPLGLQGTVAGAGDLVQARRNGWQLVGYEGNRRGPINREHYRVLETTPDGGLIVAPVLSHSHAGEHLGDRMNLPAGYVTDHVALGYATTVHAAQGLTVDTSHTVATNRTSAAGLYVGMSRGRDANTAHVVTIAVPDDAPPGTTNQIARRDPLAVLSRENDPRLADGMAAIAQAERNTAEAASLRTIAERFADACTLATAGRTTALLDRLVDDGHLTTAQRAGLAADDGLCSLDRVLRQAEIAGHYPSEVLAGAARGRDLTSARSLASVLHHRITETVDLHPVGQRYSEWIPAVDDPVWRRHLTDLARAADDRRDHLGRQVLDTQPAWAQDAFGPIPEHDAGRDEWITRAAAVAAHRELAGHDDTDVALPGPPKQGQAEAYASWRAAWRALGRDEASRAEAEMSDGQLRVRVRAYQREQTWEPDYVAHELSGTLQAAERHRTTAVLRAAEAATEPDDQRRAALDRQAAESHALADVLAQRAADLEHADEVRALWYAHTAETRAAAQRARDELAARGIDPDHDDRTITAEHWLQAHRDHQAEDDLHRVITDETDLTQVVDQRDADHRTLLPQPVHAAALATADASERGIAAAKPVERDTDDWTRVPTAEETAGSVTRAQRALTELELRRADERERDAEDDRTRQLGRWHDRDRRVELAHDNSVGFERM